MDRKNSKIKKTLGAALLMSSCGLVGGAAFGGVAAADHECTTENYSWTNPTLSQIATWNSTMGTGLTIPAPAAGVTLTVLGTSYSVFDSLGEGEPEITREFQNESNEQFSIRVGGTEVGGLSADVPDSVSQGAATPWFSGVVAGSVGGAGTSLAGGAIVIQHSGRNETPNSFSVKTLSIDVERCEPHETTTTAPGTTTTTPGTTTTAPGATTTTPGATTTTPIVTSTTQVASGGPTTTVATGGGGTVTTTPGGSLPVTGGDMTFPLSLAVLAAGTGAALLMVRRKATPDA